MAPVRDESTALTPVNNTTRREVVMDALRRAVLSGELAPGQRVKEAPLAEALGVSRPTIREAISGQICRCTGYTTIVRSIQWAAAHSSADEDATDPKSSEITPAEVESVGSPSCR